MLIEVDGMSVEIIRKRIKNMYLRIYPPDGGVKISAPLKMPLDIIRNHVITKHEWISKARARYASRPATPILTMQTGELHYFLGTPHQLIMHENLSPKQAPQIRLIPHNGDENFMHCFVPPGLTDDQKKMVLKKWYTQQMQQRLPELIKKWEAIIGVQVFECKIKQMKTRWGSCNVVTHRIWLNLNLIQKSLPCLESVLVHEMTHLHEANHSKRFYALMDHFMPGWRQHQQELKP